MHQLAVGHGGGGKQLIVDFDVMSIIINGITYYDKLSDKLHCYVVRD